MSGDDLSYRRKALEESFFARKDEELLRKLRDQNSREEQKRMLSSLTGTSDAAVLERMLDLGIRPETWAAMTFIPMIAVAWADGVLDVRERQEILRAATEHGVAEDGPGYQLLVHWLDENPGAKSLDAWKGYVQALLPSLDPDARQKLKEYVLGLAHEVARSAGGVLGVAAISAREKRVMEELEKVFQ